MNVRQTIPNWVSLICLSIIAILFGANRGHAELLMFTIITDKSTYTSGELVEWQVTLSVQNSTPATNFGIAALSVDLEDSFGNTLIPGFVNKTASPNFANYDFSSPGTWDPGTSKMYEITVLEFSQSPDVIGVHGSQLDNILFASGSLIATSPGMHTLTGTPGSTNLLFTAPNQSFFIASPFQSISFTNAMFNVSAVPEPCTAALLCFALGGCVGWRKFSKLSRLS